MTGRLFEGRTRIVVRLGLTAAAALVFLTMHSSRDEYTATTTAAPAFGAFGGKLDQGIADMPMGAPPEAKPTDALAKTTGDTSRRDEEKNEAQGRMGNFAGQLATNGIVDGVRPVAMPLPSYDHSVTITRELVTTDRPFNVTLVYVTETTLRLLSSIWILCVIGLGWSSRDRLRAWRDAIKNRVSPVVVPEAAE